MTISNRKFPKPPDINAAPAAAHSPTPPSAHTERQAQALVHEHTLETDIANDDITFILDNELKPIHRHDPDIISFITSYIHTNNISATAKAINIHHSTCRAMLNRKDIYTAVSKIRDTAALKYGLDPHSIVTEVRNIAEFDPAQLTRSDGSFYENLNDIPADARRAIKKFKAKNIYEKDPNGFPIVVGKLIEVEFHDKLKASEMIGREANLFKETKRLEHDVTANMRDLLLASKDRAERAAIEARQPLIDITPTPGAVSPEAMAAYKLMRPPDTALSQNETDGEDT